MSTVRYQVTYGASKQEPIGAGSIGAFGWLDVEQQADVELTDRAAYLLASNAPGVLIELLRINPPGFAWREGMPIPGEMVTADMVGMTLTKAIEKTLFS